ncbi:MAG: hypothetical protein QM817_40315 [Archangium sp.]
MKRALLLAVVLAGTSCSLIFDPSKVPLPCTAPSAPEALSVEAGSAMGRLVWTWKANAAGTHQLCTTVPGGMPNCVSVSCTIGSCSSIQDGVPTGVRVTGEVSAPAACDAGPLMTASASGSTFDPTSTANWSLEQKDCGTVDTTVNAGVIGVEQTGLLCVTAFATGDDAWGDLTLDAEIRISNTAPNVSAGFLLAQNGSGHRLRLISGLDRGALTPSEIKKRVNGGEVTQAQGLHFIDTDWVHVRIVRRGASISWQQGPVGGALVEVLRFHDRDAQPGRFGVTANGFGRFEVRNLRVSTATEPFPAAEESVSWFPGEDGGLAKARTSGVATRSVPCPDLPAACDAGCAPPAGAFCLDVPQFGYAAFSGPRGLEPTRDWEVALRFAVPDGGMGNKTLLSVPAGPAWDVSPTQTSLAGTAVPGLVLQPGWHYATVQLPADGGRLTGSFDGVAATSTFTWPPSDTAGRSIDAMQLGAFLNGGTYLVHELSVKQR